jgi:hypothetical protein
MFCLTFHLPPFRQQSRLDRHGLDRANEFAGKRRVDAKPTEHHTPAHAERRVTAVAAIDGLTGTSGVDDAQSASAPPAYQKASKQRASAAARLRTVPAAVRVGGELLLVPLELVPVDVAFVVTLQQDLTVPKRAMMAVGLARPAGNDLGSVDTFAVSVNAGMERVLQHRNDIAVSNWRPIERCHPLAVGRAREMQLLDLERQMHLAGAAEFAKAPEDLARDFLNPEIRIEAETNVSMPYVADWHGDPEFAPSRLGPGCVEHPRSQNAEFELTDTALHTQKQAIVRTTGIVDAIKVDDTGIDETA